MEGVTDIGKRKSFSGLLREREAQNTRAAGEFAGTARTIGAGLNSEKRTGFSRYQTGYRRISP
jgi:hypothetical protein